MKQKELLDRAENFGKSRDEYIERIYNRFEKLLSQDWVSEEQRSRALDRLIDLLEKDVSGSRKGRAGAWIAMAVVAVVILLGSMGVGGWAVSSNGEAKAAFEDIADLLEKQTLVAGEPKDGVKEVRLGSSDLDEEMLKTLKKFEAKKLTKILRGESAIGTVSTSGVQGNTTSSQGTELRWTTEREEGGTPIRLGSLATRADAKAVKVGLCGMCWEPTKKERDANPNLLLVNLTCHDSYWYSTGGSLAFRFVQGMNVGSAKEPQYEWTIEFAELKSAVGAGLLPDFDTLKREQSETVMMPNFVTQTQFGVITSAPGWITHSSWTGSYAVAMGVGVVGWHLDNGQEPCDPQCVLKNKLPRDWGCCETADGCAWDVECSWNDISNVNVAMAAMAFGDN